MGSQVLDAAVEALLFAASKDLELEAVRDFLELGNAYLAALTECRETEPLTSDEVDKQAKRQAKQEQLFNAAKQQGAVLSWDAMLQARVDAELAFKAYKGGDLKKKIQLTRDVLLMRLHSDCPPDRVRV